MFVKSLFSIALFSLFAMYPLHAKIWTVAPRPGADFTTLSGAIGSASVLAGDTILVSGAPAAYTGFTVNKKLTIIGPGYFLGENVGIQADTNAAKINSAVTIYAPGTSIMGLHFLSSLFISADTVTISRCRMEVSTLYENPVYIYAYDSIIVRQCYITQSAQWYPSVTIQGGATRIYLRNNYIEYTGGNTSYGAISVITSAISGDISNNTIYGDVDNAGGGFTFNNNILRSGNFSSTGVTYNNNIAVTGVTGILSGNGNQIGVSESSIFVGTGSSDAKWQIIPSSLADNAGLDGTDCGMFGGASPYRLSGAPSIPLVYSIDGSIDGTLLYMNVQVKSNN